MKNPNHCKILKIVSVILLLQLLLVTFVTPLSSRAQGASATIFDNLVILLMENQGYCDVMTTCGGSGQYETSLALTYSISGNCQSDSSCSVGGYSATSHPSEGNYISLVGGDNFGNLADGFCCWGLTYPNIVDRIESAGLTWNAYAEDASGSGSCSFTPPRRADHFAFLTFSDMQTTTRCSHFLTTSSPSSPSAPPDDHEFLAELNSTSPANFIWLTPNDRDNGHNTGVVGGDAYLANLVPRILFSKVFQAQKAVLFIAYDEGKSGCAPSPCSGSSNDFVFSSWSGPVVKRGFVGAGSYNHYSFLRTVEKNWAIAALTSNDANASPMTEFFLNQTGSPPSNPTGNGGCLLCQISQGLTSPIALVIEALVIASVVAIISVAVVRRRSRKRFQSRPYTV